MSEDEELQRLAELREKCELDERSALQSARAEGRKEKQKDIAKKLLKMGMKIEDIEKATDLTKEEIETL